MENLVGKTIKKAEVNKGVPYFLFDDGSHAFVNLYLSENLSKECRDELDKSIAEKETYLFVALSVN